MLEARLEAVQNEESFLTVLEFWFSPRIEPRWFNASPELDAEIRGRFQSLWQAGVKGMLDDWMDSAEGCLGLAIVLDQFPLNMYRGMALSFSSLNKAIEVSQHAIEHGLDARLSKDRLAFLYMPLMHSEHIADQNRSVALFEAAGLEANVRFARHHRDLIRRFGRFPHRNAILGRKSTRMEEEYLASEKAFTG